MDCCCPPPCRPPPHRRHHHEADGLDILDVLAKTPGLYLVPELRYPWFGLVWYGLVWYGMVWFGMIWFGLISSRKPQASI